MCNSGILFFQMLMNVLTTYMTATLMQTVQTSQDPITVFATHHIMDVGKSALLKHVSVVLSPEIQNDPSESWRGMGVDGLE